MIFVIFYFVLVIPFCFLQAYLSKKENKWMGLIIPFVKIFISLLFISLLYINIISNLNNHNSFHHPFRNILFIGGIFNISTIVYFIIYFVCRNQIKHKGEIEKMQIRDL